MSEARDAGQPLQLSGAVTIRDIDAVKSALLARITRNARVEIDLAAVEETDLGLVQLLLAADISAAKAGARLQVRRPLPPAVQQALTRCGFPSEPVGALDPTANIWTREA